MKFIAFSYICARARPAGEEDISSGLSSRYWYNNIMYDNKQRRMDVLHSEAIVLETMSVHALLYNNNNDNIIIVIVTDSNLSSGVERTRPLSTQVRHSSHVCVPLYWVQNISDDSNNNKITVNFNKLSIRINQARADGTGFAAYF